MQGVREGTPGELVLVRSDLVGATEDEQQGLWQLQLIGERYYSEVLKRVEGPNSHRHVCDPDPSPTTP